LYLNEVHIGISSRFCVSKLVYFKIEMDLEEERFILEESPFRDNFKILCT